MRYSEPEIVNLLKIVNSSWMTEWFTISGGLLYTLGLDSKLISCTPKIYYIWLFLSFFAGKASSFEKIQNGSGPPLAISPSRLPKAQLTSALLEFDAYPMSKTHIFHSSTAVSASCLAHFPKVCFRPRAEISPSRSPTVWFTPALLVP